MKRAKRSHLARVVTAAALAWHFALAVGEAQEQLGILSNEVSATFSGCKRRQRFLLWLTESTFVVGSGLQLGVEKNSQTKSSSSTAAFIC